MNSERQIVPGVSVDSFGRTKTDPAIRNVLVDLAIDLERATRLPVSVDHVVAAIRLAARKYKVLPNRPIRADDTELVKILIPHVKTAFSLLQRQSRDKLTGDE